MWMLVAVAASETNTSDTLGAGGPVLVCRFLLMKPEGKPHFSKLMHIWMMICCRTERGCTYCTRILKQEVIKEANVKRCNCLLRLRRNPDCVCCIRAVLRYRTGGYDARGNTERWGWGDGGSKLDETLNRRRGKAHYMGNTCVIFMDCFRVPEQVTEGELSNMQVRSNPPSPSLQPTLPPHLPQPQSASSVWMK